MHFTIRTFPSQELEVMISVSKKVSKKAVTRNLVKRRLRAVLRELKLKPAKYVVVAKSGAENIRGEELRLELEKLIKLRS